jgi:hypothetical protein
VVCQIEHRVTGLNGIRYNLVPLAIRHNGKGSRLTNEHRAGKLGIATAGPLQKGHLVSTRFSGRLFYRSSYNEVARTVEKSPCRPYPDEHHADHQYAN